MSYKTIKAFLPNPTTISDIMPPVFTLASKFDAHVTGVHVIEGIRYYGTADPYIPESVYQAQRDAFKEQADNVRSAFLQLAEKHGGSFDYQCDGSFHPDLFGEVQASARTSDLFVVGSDAVDDLDLDWDAASTVALKSGRPVLLVPNGWVGKPIGDRIMVAWNGSREAARAAFDAMPFLEKASDVVIVTVDEKRQAGGTSFSPADDLAAVLSRHGVEAEVVTLPYSGRPIDEELKGQITAYRSDLLVMGCYGHSRFREFILGGATRGVLRKPTIPTLLAH